MEKDCTFNTDSAGWNDIFSKDARQRLASHVMPHFKKESELIDSKYFLKLWKNKLGKVWN